MEQQISTFICAELKLSDGKQNYCSSNDADRVRQVRVVHRRNSQLCFIQLRAYKRNNFNCIGRLIANFERWQKCVMDECSILFRVSARCDAWKVHETDWEIRSIGTIFLFQVEINENKMERTETFPPRESRHGVTHTNARRTVPWQRCHCVHFAARCLRFVMPT